jgi:hypothetical protein
MAMGEADLVKTVFIIYYTILHYTTLHYATLHYYYYSNLLHQEFLSSPTGTFAIGAVLFVEGAEIPTLRNASARGREGAVNWYRQDGTHKVWLVWPTVFKVGLETQLTIYIYSYSMCK